MISEHTPVRKARSKRGKKYHSVKEAYDLRQKTESGSIEQLDARETNILLEEASHTTRLVSNLQQALLSLCSCGGTRRKQLIAKANSRFEDQLDIRTFVKVRTDLNLLLKLFLSD